MTLEKTTILRHCLAAAFVLALAPAVVAQPVHGESAPLRLLAGPVEIPPDGQILQVNVSDLQFLRERAGRRSPGAHGLIIDFLDDAGNPVLHISGEPLRKEVDLLPGHTESLALAPQEVHQRELLVLVTPRIVVHPSEPTGAQSAPPPVAVSLEIFDNRTGRTLVFSQECRPPMTQTGRLGRYPVHLHLFSSVGVAEGQSAALNIGWYPPDPGRPGAGAPGPLNLLVGFLDEDGEPVVDSAGRQFLSELELMPFEVQTLMMTDGEFEVGFRRQIRAFVRFVPAPDDPPGPPVVPEPGSGRGNPFVREPITIDEIPPASVEVSTDDGVEVQQAPYISVVDEPIRETRDPDAPKGGRR